MWRRERSPGWQRIASSQTLQTLLLISQLKENWVPEGVHCWATLSPQIWRCGKREPDTGTAPTPLTTIALCHRVEVHVYAVRCGQKINPNYWPNYWPLCWLVYRVILKSINSLFYVGQLPQLDPNCWSFRLLPHNITFTYYFCLCAQIPEFVLPRHLDALNAYKCVKSPNSSVPHSGPVNAGFICIPIIGE